MTVFWELRVLAERNAPAAVRKTTYSRQDGTNSAPDNFEFHNIYYIFTNIYFSSILREPLETRIRVWDGGKGCTDKHVLGQMRMRSRSRRLGR